MRLRFIFQFFFLICCNDGSIFVDPSYAINLLIAYVENTDFVVMVSGTSLVLSFLVYWKMVKNVWVTGDGVGGMCVCLQGYLCI